jgi:hypothetical protein
VGLLFAGFDSCPKMFTGTNVRIFEFVVVTRLSQKRLSGTLVSIQRCSNTCSLTFWDGVNSRGEKFMDCITCISLAIISGSFDYQMIFCWTADLSALFPDSTYEITQLPN